SSFARGGAGGCIASTIDLGQIVLGGVLGLRVRGPADPRRGLRRQGIGLRSRVRLRALDARRDLLSARIGRGWSSLRRRFLVEASGVPAKDELVGLAVALPDRRRVALVNVSYARGRLDEEPVVALVADLDRRGLGRASLRGIPAVIVLIQADPESRAPAERPIRPAVARGGDPDTVSPRVQPPHDQQRDEDRKDAGPRRNVDRPGVASEQTATCGKARGRDGRRAPTDLVLGVGDALDRLAVRQARDDDARAGARCGGGVAARRRALEGVLLYRCATRVGVD